MDNVKYKYRKNQSFWGLIFFMISFDFFMIFLILHLHFFNKGKTKAVLGACETLICLIKNYK